MHLQQITMHLNTPLLIKGKKISQKDIILIAHEKRHLLAEFSYIEGLHPPLLSSPSILKIKIEEMLESNFFKQTLQEESLDKSFIFFNKNRPSIHPSFLFVFEQFLVSHYFYKKKETINLPLHFPGQLLLDQNILLSLEQQFSLWASLLTKNTKINRVKIKLGKRPWDLEKKLFEMILKQFPGLRFRLDFNRRATEEASSYLPFLEQYRFCIEYLESPPSSLKDYFPLGLDLGLDLSFQKLESWEKKINDILNSKACAFILKPSILGLGHSLKLSENALSQKIKISFSSCYESPLAHFLMAFALEEYLILKNHQEYAPLLAYGTWDYVLNQSEINQALQELAQHTLWPNFCFEDSIILE